VWSWYVISLCFMSFEMHKNDRSEKMVQIFICHSTHSSRPLKYLHKWLTVFFVASEICLELKQWSVCRGWTLCVTIVLVTRFEVLTEVLLKTETLLGCDTLSLDE